MGDAAPAIAFLAKAFRDSYGKGLDIQFEDDVSGRSTHVGGMARFRQGRLIQNINVRYAVQTNQEEMLHNLAQTCEKAGFKVENLKNDPPCYTSLEHPAIPALMEAYQKIYNDNAQPYVMGGGTYSRKLECAVGFGPGMPENSPYGGGHQANEGMRIELLTNMVEIYANALLKIDELI